MSSRAWTVVFVLAAATSRAQPLVPPDHVVIVVEENKAYSQIIGSSAAPYINGLVPQGALFTQSFGITHPSQPNYIAFFAGSTLGVTDNSCPHTFSAPNLGSELLGAGLTFAGYSQGLPSTGSTVCTSGSYMRKHNPWVNFTNVPSSANKPFTSFPSTFTSLPTLSIVVPDQANDMHDGSITQGDTWLRQNLDAYVQWAKTHNSLFILTFDEDDDAHGNQIATIFVGPMVRPGRYGTRIDHYNVLRTLEDLYGLPHAGNAASAAPIVDIWTTVTTPTPTPTPTRTPTPSPTPTPCPGCAPFEVVVPASRVSASTSDGNLPGNTVDGLLSTRWSGSGDGAWIRYDLGQTYNVSFVTIAVYNGNSRRNRFDLQVSSDGTVWTSVLTNVQSGGTTTQEETFEFPDVDARWVRYVGHMSNVGAFNSLTEVSVYARAAIGSTPTPVSTPTPSPTPTPTVGVTPTATPSPTYVEVTPPGTAVSASTSDTNVPANAVDGSLATRWSGNGDGAWLQLDLGASRRIGYVRVATFSGNTRRGRFDLQVSPNASTWTTVLPGAQTSGVTTLEETFDFADVDARYVRYLGHGNTDPAKASWNSVTEISVFAVP